MTKRFPHTHTFSTRLILGLTALILATTLSAGVPAFWLTRTQLERQAWSQVESIRQTTRSLLQAEQNRLDNLALLLAERPTLEQLANEQDWDELLPYLRAFQTQSTLDIVLFCRVEDGMRIGEPGVSSCPTPGQSMFMLVNDRPAMLASRPVAGAASSVLLGVAVTGEWLDAAFLQQLATVSGAQQSILSMDGARLSTTLPATAGTNQTSVPHSQSTLQATLALGGARYFTARTPLVDGAGAAVMQSEVALPVDDLFRTENRALAILVMSTGLVALGGGLIAFWYIRRMTQPLWELTSIARQIAVGDFIAPIPSFSGPVEVTTLAEALQRSHATMRQALGELAQARDWLNNLIQSIVEGVIIFDPNKRIHFFSQGAEALTGVASAEAVGRSIGDILHLAEDGPETFLDVLPAPGQRQLIDITTQSDQALTLSVTSAQLAPVNGDKPQTALVLRDVTEEAAGRHLRSYFLSNITHEFRTPLSTLSASLELLLDEHETLTADEMRQLLKPTYLSLLSLQTLIDNLLESSKIEARRFTIRRQPVDLRRLVDDAVRIVRPLLDRRRQSLMVTGLDEAPEVEVDGPHLTQALVNLLSNAGRYSPVSAQIDLHIDFFPDKLRIAIADRGPGIPEGERVNLFRRFVRLDSEGGEQYGIGLGLFVVKTTVESHGGQIGVNDRPEGGSVFWIEMPV
jgi:two-component system phosphate regulon sensor histidine kinase PhoR